MTHEPVISHDFNFQIGSWRVSHRRLMHRLVGCQDWEEFEGTCVMAPVLGGNGNIEDNVIDIPSGCYRAIAVRSFDPIDGTWAIWWLDSRWPHRLDVPVIGKFANGIGTFFAEDSHEGRPVRLRFEWLRTDTATPRWEQATSVDAGRSWEINWTMDFHRQATDAHATKVDGEE